MKNFWVLFLCVFGVFSSAAKAQIIQVTFNGTISSTSGLDSSVQVGNPFSEVFTFNLSTPVADSESGATSFIDNTGSTVATYGNDALTFASPIITLKSNASGYYGIVLENVAPTTLPDGFKTQTDNEVMLVAFNSKADPGQLLTSSVFTQLSLNNFPNASMSIEVGSRTSFPSSEVGATITSVSVATVPEPSTLLLVALGVVAFVGMRLRIKAD